MASKNEYPYGTHSKLTALCAFGCLGYSMSLAVTGELLMAAGSLAFAGMCIEHVLTTSRVGWLEGIRLEKHRPSVFQCACTLLATLAGFAGLAVLCRGWWLV